MRAPLAKVMALTATASVFTACLSDEQIAQVLAQTATTVQLRYVTDAKIERLPSAQAVTIFQFADRRGDEGDRNPLRVGGVYDSYGRRMSRVSATAPWPEKLVEALAAGFTQRGVEAVAVMDRELLPRETSVSTPFALGGEIRNFSTEARWTLQSHVSGIIRLYDNRGTLRLEKTISARITGPGDTWDRQTSVYENSLNSAIQQFVHAVVTDPELTQLLLAAR